MKVSIITVCYNSQHTIEKAIRSVHNQTYNNLEHIVVDGKSTDDTQKIVLKLLRPTDIYISEPDEGIYDAMNKGINLATGDIIGILNSDDFYANNTVIEDVIKFFETTNSDAVHGDLEFVKADDISKTVRYWKGSPYTKGAFKRGWHPSHPTFFVKKSFYEKYGVFDNSLDVSADFELMLRFIEKHQIRTHYLNKTLVKMRYGGESTGSLNSIIKGNRNIMKAFNKNDIIVSPLYPFYRLLPKLKQFISK